MTASPESPRVIYIVGMGHSGSTLLDFLLSTHSGITSVGEAKTLARARRPRCTCRKSVEECPFWSQVAERVARLTGRPLADLRMMGSDADFVRDNEVFFRAVADAASTRWIVDSSKSYRRLQGLLRAPGLEVLPIHLVRDPRGVVFSNLKKGRTLEEYSRKYVASYRRVRSLLAGHPHLVVRYESLAAQPRAALQEIHAWLGVPFEEGQLEWAGGDRHNLGGNRLRFNPGSEIRVDLGWQSALDSAQQSAILELTREAWPP